MPKNILLAEISDGHWWCFVVEAIDKGLVPTSGWGSGFLTPWINVSSAADCIQDDDFIAEPPCPGAIVLEVLTTVYAVWYGVVPERMRVVRVHSSKNNMEARFNDEKMRVGAKGLLFGAEILWPLTSDAPGGDVPWPE